ncbi:GNAT family N-acetyltransferase [Tropicimonas sediminicola]|uniref:Protein N-acetyltransferase, RimJ/RimL family n=1 Tax=Tropicimonas sediminicola TaxID=1031541 RepID=A0A239I2J3_9RHOB|nr:GNAT family protein [Tropicimonas sediminicola]SNS87592.1 Protein N-acetyltransferase, RimJ/RimL family [Tropicimonas sediminicola]
MALRREPRTNALGQPIGWPLDVALPRPRPHRAPMQGRFCTLEPADPEVHAASLFEAFATSADHRIWTYLPYGPFDSAEALADWMRATCLGNDPMFFTLREAGAGRCLGLASYLRIDPGNGSVEVGHINFSPLVQRTPMATEAMFLMADHAMTDLAYRRYEWKCDALNAPSRAAAERLGFLYEGTFRQAAQYKGRNRDTAWFAFTDGDWPRVREALAAWLAPENFDADGQQRRSLAAIRQAGSA